MEMAMKALTKLIEIGTLIAMMLAASFPAGAGVRCAKTALPCGPRMQDTAQDLAAHEVRNYAYPQDHSWDVRSQGANGGGTVGGR
jgi:hypothetical protein